MELRSIRSGFTRSDRRHTTMRLNGNHSPLKHEIFLLLKTTQYVYIFGHQSWRPRRCLTLLSFSR